MTNPCHPQWEEHNPHGGAFFTLVLGLFVFLLPGCHLSFGSAPQAPHKGQCSARQ